MRTETREVFKFDELSDQAKEKAREWYRQGALDYEWYEHVYEDAATCGAILGIAICQKSVKLMGGGTRLDPSIYFSGFCHQGQGAAFDGRYEYAKGASKKIRRHAPQDKELHSIADRLQEVQRKSFYRLKAQVKQKGNYFWLDVSVYDSETGDYAMKQWQDDEVTECMRDFAHWIYRQLEKEHDWLMSDECVDDSIRANEYEFYGNGAIA